jgi:hypothetical protein
MKVLAAQKEPASPHLLGTLFGMSTPPDYRPIDWAEMKSSFLRMFERIGAFFNWVGEHEADIRDFLEKAPRHQRGEWGYLLGLFGGTTGLTLALAIEARTRYGEAFDEAIGHGLEAWLLEDELLAEVHQAVENAALPTATTRQLQAGLEHLKAHDYDLAVPLLIIPLEGAFWRLAIDRGLVVKNTHDQWVQADRPEKRIRAVEGLFPLDGLNLSESQLRFLRGLAYGTRGHPYRHGQADDGYQIRALCLFVSLMAWLELAGHFEVRSAIRAASMRASEERREREQLVGG